VDVELDEMDGSSLREFVARSRTAYVEESVAAGRDRADAERAAGEVLDRAFPGGTASHGHVVFDILVAGNAGGCLWLGPRSPERRDAWWVWDIEVDASHRGRGVGRSAMQLAEDEARSRGATSLGLHVFGDNGTARRLYESLGYLTDAEAGGGVLMSKPL
jgi:ribosomal protein S18 acetylase RimI-like enzyme